MDHQRNRSALLQDFHTAFILQQLANGSQRQDAVSNGSFSVNLAAASRTTTRTSSSSTPPQNHHTSNVARTTTTRSRPVSPPTAGNNGVVELEVASDKSHWDTNLSFPIRPLHAPPKLQRFPLRTSTNALLKTMPDGRIATNSTNRSSSSSGRTVLRPMLPSVRVASVRTVDADESHLAGRFASRLPAPIVFPSRARSISISEMTSKDHSDQKHNIVDIQCAGKSSTHGITMEHSRQRLCKMEGCSREVTHRSVYCSSHFGQRRCDFQKCHKFAQGRTRFCIGHGGGRRCKVNGCVRAARDRWFCAAHGGGKRCAVGSCTRLVVGRGHKCTWHQTNQRCSTARDEQSLQPTLQYNEEKREETYVPVLCTEIAKDVY